MTDEYFAKHGSLNNEEKVRTFKKSKFYKDSSSSMSEVKITAVEPPERRRTAYIAL